MTGMRHGRRFARRSQHEQSIGPCPEMQIDETAERIEIDRAVLRERRDQRHDRAFKPSNVHSGLPFSRAKTDASRMCRL